MIELTKAIKRLTWVITALTIVSAVVGVLTLLDAVTTPPGALPPGRRGPVRFLALGMVAP